MSILNLLMKFPQTLSLYVIIFELLGVVVHNNDHNDIYLEMMT